LAPQFNGRGYVTRGIKYLEDLAFGRLGINRMQIQIDVNNVKSQVVAVRAGYKKEGVLRQAYVLRGVPCDLIMYSKLKSEWEKGKVK
jgi:RimJ/RimL family protein N-acetyltransferase